MKRSGMERAVLADPLGWMENNDCTPGQLAARSPVTSKCKLLLERAGPRKARCFGDTDVSHPKPDALSQAVAWYVPCAVCP